jgi:hypothetical protein
MPVCTNFAPGKIYIISYILDSQALLSMHESARYKISEGSRISSNKVDKTLQSINKMDFKV